MELNFLGLLFIYDNSLRKLLEDIYPNVQWKIWLFEDELVPSGYWNDKKNQVHILFTKLIPQRAFLEYVGLQEKYTSLEDYYNLTSNDLKFLMLI